MSHCINEWDCDERSIREPPWILRNKNPEVQNSKDNKSSNQVKLMTASEKKTSIHEDLKTLNLISSKASSLYDIALDTYENSPRFHDKYHEIKDNSDDDVDENSYNEEVDDNIELYTPYDNMMECSELNSNIINDQVYKKLMYN